MIAKQIGISTPEWAVARSVEETEKSAAAIGLPVVIKPASGGSSIGISICKNSAEVSGGAKISLEQESVALVEQFIDGPLLTAGIVGDISLPVIQIETGDRFYDFAHKYTKGTTSYHLPPKVDKTIVEKVSDWAMKMHKTIGCSGVSRSEFMCGKDGTAYFLEINTIPGMTGTSLLPKGAMAAGLDFDRLVEKIVAEVSL
jgi:D-alanine-D-alanine ligase